MNDNEKQSEYKVLARKYRPQTFADLIGQETLVQTLTNAITTNRIAHAYLLTGVRGIGKTTTARLIAMSLNCESRDSDTFEPCSNCQSCHSIREDRNMDVIEMDAASKTGVDDIREIIDNVKYKPINCKYKIFIIDEVHMLSKSAFNALLKTLEEPPPHIKFIFATTEIKKIPITIISRCQRFDLHRVDAKILIDHLISISKKENIIISKDALAIIVRAADGSVRDGLSLLDQASANASKEISSEIVINMLGLANRDIIFDLIENIFIGDANKSLEIYNSLYKSGADVVMIFDEMLKVVHFLTQIKIMKNIKDDINIPELERKKGIEIGEKISISTLGLIWQVLFKGFQELQTGFNVFQLGEMLIIRLIYLYRGPSPEDLINKIEKDFPKKDLNKEINKNLKSNDPTSYTVNKNENLTNSHKDENNTNLLQVISFRQLVDLFYQNKEAILHTYLYNNVKLIS
ncbi:MAG: DNA polymerase III subunit tau, partial [Alphaproteobacteria bacterium MarineAlpha5_Bin8]